MQKQTTHPTPEELGAYSLGQLPADEAAAIESHISECEPCCETIVGLSSDDSFVALLQEARQLPADQTLDHDGLLTKPSLSLQDVPTPLAEHPRYEIVGLIGKGGMGAVYQARHRMMERTVALKVINRELMRKPEAVDRFHREVKTAARLSHPNIVTAYDAEQAGDVHFLVMEYVDGVDLSHTVKDRGRLPIAEACDYIRQAAVGLQYAHERGMVHRDIKPHNLMVMADGAVKVLDFGLASLAPHASPDTDTVEARGDLTAAGVIMGTPDFISPEQADDARQADIRSDIYSLGATLYFLLSGQPPFVDGSVMQKLKSHAEAEPQPLESLREDIPTDLAAIVSRMMAKAPDNRFQTQAEVAAALAPFSRHDAKTAPAKVPTKWPIIMSVCVSAILALLAGVVFVVTDKGTLEIKSEFDDVEIVVSKGGEEYTVIDLATDSKVHRLPSGQYKVNLKGRGDLALSSDGFTLKRSGTAVVNVTLKEPQKPDGPRAASGTASGDQSPETSLDSEMRAVLGRLQQRAATATDQDLVEKRLAETRARRAEGRRRASADNLRQLGLGFHRFHETYHHLPSSQGGQIVFFDGTASRSKPTQPYSWRVAMLPFIGHAELYQQYHFDEPWDSENNLELLEKMPAVYRFPQSGVGSTTTCYAALVGEHTALAATKNLKFSEILDGTANTLLLVEAKTTIPWTKPEDLKYSPDQPLPAIGGFDEHGVNVLFADGSVRFLEHPIDEGRIRALASRDGREQIEEQKSQQAEDDVSPEIAASLATSDKPKQDDHQTIQGVWQVVYSADSGRVAPQEILKTIRFIFADDTLTMEWGGRKSETRYRLDPSTAPKSIDSIENGRTTLGIYDLQGDTLKICLSETQGGQRPFAFESKPDSVNDVLIMLRRVDPGEHLENQRDKIKGMWRVVSYEDDGRSLEYWKKIRLKIDLGVTQAIFTWYAGEKGDQELMTVYRLDPDGNAGWIDEDDEDGSRGIYELEGDTLRICKADERPTEYESKPGSTLIVLKRDTQQLSDAAAMELIPEAASITNDDFQKLSASPRPDTIDNKSLSLVLMTLHPSKQAEQNPAVLNDFRYLKGIIPKAATLAEAMWISRGKGYASFIQPEYISDCKTTSTSGVATGTVFFNADKLYAGAVEFTARRIDDAWRIEEFRLPNYGIRTVRGEDGKWSRLPLAGQQQSDQESAATQIKLPSDSASINQIAELLDAWKILPDASEESEEYAKKIMTLRIELSKQHTPNTESSRQTSARLALLAWPHLSDAIPTPMAQTLADLTKPDAAVRVSDRLAEEGRPTEPLGWDVQAAHALALARAGKTEEALKENETLMNKIDANVRKGRLPELQLKFFGTTRSQKSLLKQMLLQKALILAIAGKTAESLDAATAAGNIEVDNRTEDDQAANQAMLRVLTKAHKSPVKDIQPAESDTSAIRKTTAFLVEAAKSGDLEAVKAALESGVDPNGPRDQLTALHWAVAQRISDGKTIEPSPEIARRLIEAGANVNAKDYLGQTPLEWAATYAPPEVVTMLIKAGTDVNAESRYGTVLMAARRVEIAKLLIEAGADVNAGKITSPLASAAKNGNAELIQLLVENGAQVNDPKDPPIHWAGKADAAKALLEAGADVNQRNKNGETALHLAKNTWSPNAETVKLLIEAGADVKAKNVTGATPLHAAVQMAKPEIAKLVIAAGADVDAKDKQGNTPLSLAHASLAWARGQQQVDNRPYEAVVKVLVDAGAKDDGRTELQQAVAAGDLQRVKELIATKVDVNKTGPQRITAVHIASDKGHGEILAALIEAGAKVDVVDAQRMRPLHLAANAETARLLITNDAKVNSGTPSPLYMATMNGKADVVRELLRNDAAATKSDCATILNWATFAGQIDVIKVLFELRDAKALLGVQSTYSPLHVAASGSFGGMNSPANSTPQKRLDIIKLLLEKGADVNARWGANMNPQSGAAHMIDTTPLMFASTKGETELVKFLLDQKADVQAKNASGQTALHFAAQHGHVPVVELLLKGKADVNALTREAQTPLDLTQDAAVKVLLIQNGGTTASDVLKDSRR